MHSRRLNLQQSRFGDTITAGLDGMIRVLRRRSGAHPGLAVAEDLQVQVVVDTGLLAVVEEKDLLVPA